MFFSYSGSFNINPPSYVQLYHCNRSRMKQELDPKRFGERSGTAASVHVALVFLAPFEEGGETIPSSRTVKCQTRFTCELATTTINHNHNRDTGFGVINFIAHCTTS